MKTIKISDIPDLIQYIADKYELGADIRNFLGISDDIVEYFAQCHQIEFSRGAKADPNKMTERYTTPDNLLQIDVEQIVICLFGDYYLSSMKMTLSEKGDDSLASTFEAKTIPMTEGDQLIELKVSAFVNGMALGNSFIHVLKKDAVLPEFQKDSGSDQELVDAKAKKKPIPIQLSTEHFPLPFMYELLKATVKALNLRSHVYDGITLFSVPEDPSYERIIHYNKTTRLLNYQVSGLIVGTDGTEATAMISAIWSIPSRMHDGILSPVSVTMKENYMNSTVTANVIKDRVRIMRTDSDGNVTSSAFILEERVFRTQFVQDLINLYDIYMYQRAASEPLNMDTIIDLGSIVMRLNGDIRSVNGYAKLIYNFHEGGFSRLDYIHNDLDDFIHDLHLPVDDPENTCIEICQVFFSTLITCDSIKNEMRYDTTIGEVIQAYEQISDIIKKHMIK